MSNTDKYSDIIGLSHHVSSRRASMSIYDRAAQFSPFAALTGYEEVIEETGRLTDHQIELDESSKAVLNEKLQLILEAIGEQPTVTVTWFKTDGRKSGGSYATVTGRVKKLDPYECILLLTDGTVIPIRQIYQITGELFRD